MSSDPSRPPVRGQGSARAASAALLAALLPLAMWLWTSLLYLVQLEVRNRLGGSPGESSPLYLALFGLPMVVLVTALCIVAALARRDRNSSADVARAWVVIATLTGLAVTALVVAPSYAGAISEFAALPWRVLSD